MFLHAHILYYVSGRPLGIIVLKETAIKKSQLSIPVVGEKIVGLNMQR